MNLDVQQEIDQITTWRTQHICLVNHKTIMNPPKQTITTAPALFWSVCQSSHRFSATWRRTAEAARAATTDVLPQE